MLRWVAVSDQRADPDSATVGQRLYLGEHEPVEIDQLVWSLHAHLHEVDEIGAAADEFCLRVGGHAVDRALRIVRPGISERAHDCAPPIWPRACLIASTMFG